MRRRTSPAPGSIGRDNLHCSRGDRSARGLRERARRIRRAIAIAGFLCRSVQGHDRLGRRLRRDAAEIVLGLLIWTAHGQFTAQQAQLQTIGCALILLDLAFVGYGPKAAAGRRELRDILARTRKRLWIDDPKGRRTLDYSEIANDVLPMRGVLFSLHPADDDQRRHIAALANSSARLSTTG
jgi:hypothetical protein